jgi:RNA polymerase sigma factor (sigma-70 family)
MDEPLVTITYKLADGKRIRLEVTSEVKELLEQSDRQIRSQRRQDRRYLVFTGCIDEFDDSTITAPQEDPADLVIRMDSYKQLYSALNKLSEAHKRRVHLYYYCGMTCQEIAVAESIHKTTVSRSLRKARKALEEYLTK